MINWATLKLESVLVLSAIEIFSRYFSSAMKWLVYLSLLIIGSAILHVEAQLQAGVGVVDATLPVGIPLGPLINN